MLSPGKFNDFTSPKNIRLLEFYADKVVYSDSFNFNRDENK